jgi:hypothetical protein
VETLASSIKACSVEHKRCPIRRGRKGQVGREELSFAKTASASLGKGSVRVLRQNLIPLGKRQPALSR